MPTDTERLDWYFGQERFDIHAANDRTGYRLNDDGLCLGVWPSDRFAIDYAMELEKADAE